MSKSLFSTAVPNSCATPRSLPNRSLDAINTCKTSVNVHTFQILEVQILLRVQMIGNKTQHWRVRALIVIPFLQISDNNHFQSIDRSIDAPDNNFTIFSRYGTQLLAVAVTLVLFDLLIKLYTRTQRYPDSTYQSATSNQAIKQSVRCVNRHSTINPLPVESHASNPRKMPNMKPQIASSSHRQTCTLPFHLMHQQTQNSNNT